MLMTVLRSEYILIIVLCLFLCLSSNLTFPVKSDHSKWFMELYKNHLSRCESYSKDFIERSLKMASKIENVLQKVKSSPQYLSNKPPNRLNGKYGSQLKSDNLRLYEQLVIMKKNPYLDLREPKLKRDNPSINNVQQGLKLDSNIGGDAHLCEPICDDYPSVQITNRGLSGFAIPNQMKNDNHVPNEKAPNLDSLADPKMLNFNHSKEYPMKRQLND